MTVNTPLVTSIAEFLCRKSCGIEVGEEGLSASLVCSDLRQVEESKALRHNGRRDGRPPARSA